MRPRHGLGLLVLLAACTSKPPVAAAPPPLQAPAPLDASYDWHVLMLAPFGSTVKDLPFHLHEVLLFGDPQSEGAECYGIEREAPRFLERTPDDYMLCFRHDHLARVEVTVHLPQANAGQIFADACSLWQQQALAPSAAPADAPAKSCSGRDHGIGYRGALDPDSQDADTPFTLRLDAPEQP